MGRGYMPPSKKNDWWTPMSIYTPIEKRYGPFTLDPCGDGNSPVTQEIGYCFDGTTPDLDGLAVPWLVTGEPSTVFMNPPWGLQIRDWAAKANEEIDAGRCKRVVALLPAKVGTKWWQQYVITDISRRIRPELIWLAKAHPNLRNLELLPGRISFELPDGSESGPATTACAVVVWQKRRG